MPSQEDWPDQWHLVPTLVTIPPPTQREGSLRRPGEREEPRRTSPIQAAFPFRNPRPGRRERLEVQLDDWREQRARDERRGRRLLRAVEVDDGDEEEAEPLLDDDQDMDHGPPPGMQVPGQQAGAQAQAQAQRPLTNPGNVQATAMPNQAIEALVGGLRDIRLGVRDLVHRAVLQPPGRAQPGQPGQLPRMQYIFFSNEGEDRNWPVWR
ncbi:MAG: hypothetical protein MI867_15830, partial [Pseudomonadales bacterium]|nr:hypothetical protein [Pseudomonadales bacterium]